MKLETRTIYGGFTSAAGAVFPQAIYDPTTPIVATDEPGIDFPVPYLLHAFMLSTSIAGTYHNNITAQGSIGAALVVGQHQNLIQIDQSVRLLAAQFIEVAAGTLGSDTLLGHTASRYCPLLGGPMLLDPSKNVRLYFFSPVTGSPGLGTCNVISSATLYLEAVT